jgi:hypothetical protein
MKYLKITLLFFLLHFVFAANSQTNVTLNGNGSGRTFEGVGVLSGGGGNTKLLKDYNEPYRSQILDYLFKPKFGAAFKELKVEIGADINSTSGTEPSHARTLAENANPNMTRGYETWLIDQAKKRNPNITLYGLQWGAPGWIGSMWSQTNADYLVSYIKGLKSVWGYDMDYIGGNQNECYLYGTTTQARNYIVNNLRPTLNTNGLSIVKIVAPDIYGADWSFASKLSSDASLKSAVCALGYHYVNSKTNTTALNCGLPLWETEGWTGVGNWAGAYALAKEINLNYIKGKITKTDIWHMINSQYDNVNWPHSGIMEANTPWSGWYVVSPSVWIAAHTNQFAEPGWKYLDSGCGVTSKGNSYVTFKNPNDSNYSIVIVDTLSESMTFNLSGGLSKSVVHVWKSTTDALFIQQNDITPVNGSFTINLTAGAIYSLTTTTGQQKGDAGVIPQKGSFGANYSDDFESYESGATPKYTYDIYGAFEVQNGTNTKVLRQVITGTNLEWNVWGDYPPGNPFTEFGDFTWQNYDYSADVRIETTGSACIYGRIGQPLEGRNVSDFKGYRLAVKNTGAWSLAYGNCGSYETTSDIVLASGTISGFDANAWHNLKLSLNGDSIGAYIDNVWKNTVYSNERCSGMAGLGSGFNYAQFDNISVTGKGKNSKDSIISGATYVIKNVNSGKVLSPLNGSSASGTNIVQVTYNDAKTQQWLLTNLDNGYWSIKNTANGLSMDIDGSNGSSTTDGAFNIQDLYTGANSQQWNLKYTGCNYNIINRNSGKSLDISGGSSAENVQNIQWPSNGGKNQQWEFMKVTSTGVDPIKGTLDVEVYPNPATDCVFLKFSNIPATVQVSIVNNTGQLFWTGAIKNDSLEKIDISKLPRGFYIVYASSNVDKFSKKLIVL